MYSRYTGWFKLQAGRRGRAFPTSDSFSLLLLHAVIPNGVNYEICHQKWQLDPLYSAYGQCRLLLCHYCCSLQPCTSFKHSALGVHLSRQGGRSIEGEALMSLMHRGVCIYQALLVQLATSEC